MAKIARVCDAEDCDRPVLAKGLCRIHYQRQRLAAAGPCSRTGCTTPAVARGVCRTHYTQAVKDGSAEGLTRLRQPQGAECRVDGCTKEPFGHGLCSAHYTRRRRYGSPLASAAPRPIAQTCPACGGQRAVSERSGRWRCQTCTTRRASEWRVTNPHAAKAIARRRYANNKDAWRTYSELNRERISAKAHVRRIANLEAVRAKERAAWRKLTPEDRQRRAPARSAVAALYRARKYSAVCEHGRGCVSAALLRDVRSMPCRYCGSNGGHADHYVPLARGGLHCIQNIVPACGTCNRSKGARMPDEWIAHLDKRGERT